MYMPICSMVLLQKCIYRKLGNANIARTYIDTDSHKLKQVKAVIIICQTSNQSATMEQNYCIVQSLFFNCRGITLTQGCQHINTSI